MVTPNNKVISTLVEQLLTKKKQRNHTVRPWNETKKYLDRSVALRGCQTLIMIKKPFVWFYNNIYESISFRSSAVDVWSMQLGADGEGGGSKSMSNTEFNIVPGRCTYSLYRYWDKATLQLCKNESAPDAFGF